MTFSGSLLDPADRYRNDENWLAEQLGDSRTVFLPLWDLLAFVKPGEPAALCWLRRAEIEAHMSDTLTPVFLGLCDEGRAHFAVDVDGVGTGDKAPLQDFGTFMDVRAAAAQLAGGEAGILARARSMVDWHKRHGFCARCGHASEIRRGGYLRSCTNPDCGAQHFPRVDPVVIMLIHSGDKCLLGRQSRFPEGMYSALAGFVEPGETIEEAVRRESHEEAGIRIGAVRYVSSQPWPFPSSLMIGCEAEALSEEIILDRLELEDAFWATKEQVRRAIGEDETLGFNLPPQLSIARQMLNAWVAK